MSGSMGPTRRARWCCRLRKKHEIWLKILTGESTTNRAFGEQRWHTEWYV